MVDTYTLPQITSGCTLLTRVNIYLQHFFLNVKVYIQWNANIWSVCSWGFYKCILFLVFYFLLWSLHLSNSIDVYQTHLLCQTLIMAHINMMFARQRRQWLILTVEISVKQKCENSCRQHLSLKKSINEKHKKLKTSVWGEKMSWFFIAWA